ncbi:gliding motility-associated C-terminal domain-containing protein [Chryseolinea lacunae]|uniref:Gliding motility-associated C-terminal domain-containing protein n=1 Tax=Chryseolinea lacunae TaxID=2801331 RepID=A0ABS1KSS0_9BACT|nr:gliding motility-associated C-terminal domain-containing protein [Chryseolinea lacunae]MBL0742510.1 gliding motility-associated C-terminal domain-containing protein [Chryseolinea lacunae]
MKTVIVSLCLMFAGMSAIASHIRSVQIQAEQINCASLTYRITVIAYTNYGSTVAFGGTDDRLDFGDGFSIEIPELATQEIIDPLLKVGKIQFETTHTFVREGTFIISYREANRNEGVLNVPGSVNSPYYTETAVRIGFGLCNSSPVLTVPPIDHACRGLAFYHVVGAVDPDGDSLSYQLTTPRSQASEELKNYSLPNAIAFYAAMHYDQANEAHNGKPTFAIDAQSGLLTWDAPGSLGEYSVAIKITQWKFNNADSTWYAAGYVIRDMQIVVDDCVNQRPVLTTAQDLCVEAGTTVHFTLKGSDPDRHNVVIEAFSDIFTLNQDAATVLPDSGIVQSTTPPTDTASIDFAWNTTCALVRSQPYAVVFKITDRPPAGTPLVQFQTVRITVMAPAPVFKSVSVNPVSKIITLQWQPPACENTTALQVWRRVARYTYTPSSCDTGMPKNLHYTLLAELPADATSYVDRAIDVGAQYCYRVVARVGAAKTPGRISIDTCLIPKPPEAPVVTQVSVERSRAANGTTVVTWTSPFALDKAQYPPPYAYVIYRSEGFVGNTYVQVHGPQTDTVFADVLNNEDTPHRYKIELYVPSLTGAPVDTSAAASSVFLKAKSSPSGIVLDWDGRTPWSNYVQAFPYHRIYRNETGPEDPFALIDSVDVNENGFHFMDSHVAYNKTYYYKVLTRGSYGNPDLPQPLENFSQVAIAKLDTLAPCVPMVVLEQPRCNTFACKGNVYHNILSWQAPAGCDDAVTYKVFIRDDNSGTFTLLAVVTENSFVHTGLASLAHCYAVSAIDLSGNESALSDAVCNDNCGTIAFANVITPYNHDGRNDRFEVFHNDNDASTCPRFVKSVGLKIYDRWGKEVYALDATSWEETNYTFWNGLSSEGRKVSPGVYYYSADVYFEMRDPEAGHRVVNGWVHVVE